MAENAQYRKDYGSASFLGNHCYCLAQQTVSFMLIGTHISTVNTSGHFRNS